MSVDSEGMTLQRQCALGSETLELNCVVEDDFRKDEDGREEDDAREEFRKIDGEGNRD